MKLSKLRLIGFKSFVEPTEMQIEPGLTGIVGPNGCGKSNLVEALRWVMGEASHKAMRAGGTPTSPTSPNRLRTCTLDPCRSHDRVLKRLTRKNQTITPTMSAPNATQIFMNAISGLACARSAPTCRVERFAG